MLAKADKHNCVNVKRFYSGGHKCIDTGRRIVEEHNICPKHIIPASFCLFFPHCLGVALHDLRNSALELRVDTATAEETIVLKITMCKPLY